MRICHRWREPWRKRVPGCWIAWFQDFEDIIDCCAVKGLTDVSQITFLTFWVMENGKINTEVM